MTEAFETNCMSIVGENINEVEQLAAEKIGYNYVMTNFYHMWKMRSGSYGLLVRIRNRR